MDTGDDGRGEGSGGPYEAADLGPGGACEAPIEVGGDTLAIEWGSDTLALPDVADTPAAPGIRGIDHAGMTVPDIDAATRFFQDAFGAVTLYDVLPEDGPERQ